MAIRTIAIENFLSHEETEIAPSKGLTVITGTSNGGKSNLVRAIKWGITGKPFGVDWTSWFADEKTTIRVAAEFDDNSWISREKNKNKNQYQVSTVDSPLKALRANVPDEVHDITNMSLINIQGQDDGYFMLSSSTGEVGRMFNEAVGLEIIDVMISESKKAVVVYDARYRAAQENLNSLQEQIQYYSYLDDIEPIMKDLGEGWEDLLQQGHELSVLEGLVKAADVYKEKIDGLRETIDTTIPQLDDLKHLSRSLKRRLDKLDTLGRLITTAVSYRSHIKVLKKSLKIGKNVLDVKRKAGKLTKMASEIRSLQDIVSQAEELEDERSRLSERLSALKTQYLKLLETAQTCPVCFSRISAKALSRIRSKL